MPSICFFVFNVTPPTEIYTYAHTLSLLDALPILERGCDLGGLLRLIAGQFQRGGDGAAMVRHEAGGRIDGEGMDLLRGRVGDFLDVHAALGRHDEGHAASGAVDQQSQVEFLGDVGAVGDVEAVDIDRKSTRLNSS